MRAPQSLRDLLENLTETAASEAQREATGRVHVITGRLRSSIFARKTDRFSWEVGASAPYALFEERRGESHSFLRPSFASASTRMVQRMPGELRELLLRLARGGA